MGNKGTGRPVLGLPRFSGGPNDVSFRNATLEPIRRSCVLSQLFCSQETDPVQLRGLDSRVVTTADLYTTTSCSA